MNIQSWSSPIKINLYDELKQNAVLEKQWNQCPFYVLPNRKQDAEKVLFLLEDPNLSKPSTLVGISDALVNKYPAIALINQIFTNAIEDYRIELAKATNVDFTKPISQNSSHNFQYALVVGTARSLEYQTNCQRYLPNALAIQRVLEVSFAVFGVFYGIAIKDSLIQEKNRVERSENREKWVSETLIKEKSRIKDTSNFIRARANVLKIDIEALGLNLINLEHVKELKLLNIFMKALSPATPLLFDNQPIAKYLKRRGISVEDSDVTFIKSLELGKK